MRPFRPLAPALLAVLTVGAGLAPVRAASPVVAAGSAPLVALEAALNNPDDAPLAALLQQGPGLDPAEIQARRRSLISQFPDLRWTVSAGSPTRDGQPTVILRAGGTRRQGAAIYRLDAEQRLSLRSDGRHINAQTVLREQSLLRSGGEQAPPVSVLIPDAVLTGQRYDVDVIFDDPLDGALAAGGLVAVSPAQVAAMESPSMELGALGGGGLFKRVQAPLRPGSQTWAVLLVHPRGIVTATKRVRVVADRAALTP
ncbi:hypothetical protein NZK33_17175 [Cyanobium sp. FGCU-6]|jgi:hypothetical protein|nr:hypothetical protein [Cyanobium sp. FGCU6]